MIKRFVKKDMKRARALDTHVIGITILMAHGSWLMAHGSWLMAHGSWLMA